MRMYFKTLFAFFASLCGVANAYQPTSTPFSQYGQIQNVQSYSSNPFWTPGSPYNQRMPQAVYVDGPEINAGDCQRVVSSLVANVCTTINNCSGAQLSDIRPTLMLQLSRHPVQESRKTAQRGTKTAYSSITPPIPRTATGTSSTLQSS